MRIVDYIFYFALCVTAGIAFFMHNITEDIYFSLSAFDMPQKHEIYEKEQWEVPAHTLLSVDIAFLGESKYLISYVSKDKFGDSRLYGMLFYPNKYSTNMQGTWQNIATSTQVHGAPRLLLDSTMLTKETHTLTRAIHGALLQDMDSHVFFFVNALLARKLPVLRNYILRANKEAIIEYFENPKEDGIKQLFSFQERAALTPLADVNAFFTHKPLSFVGMQNETSKFETSGLIVPFSTHFTENTAFFGIFNTSMQLQDVIKPHTDSLHASPLITPLHTNYDVKNKANNATSTHVCLALYHNNDMTKKSEKLLYQPCKASNGTLAFEELQESKNLSVGDSMSVGVFGHYVILIFTNKANNTLHLAVWNGEDFMVIKELDRSIKGNIMGVNLLVYGAHAYIVYAKDKESQINVITLNENYINGQIATQDSRVIAKL